MKTKFYITGILLLIIRMVVNGQAQQVQQNDPFNFSYWNAYAEKLQLNPTKKKEFIDAHKKLHESPIQLNAAFHKPVSPGNSQQTFAGPCINIDFENGNLNGWNPSAGFHPGFNPQGCCQTAGGQQMIMSGNGLDPAGGFPVVAPGGNFSLRLGNNQTGGQADRIEQTFLVSASNANFTYRYAVVFQDPGHAAAEQPAFTIEMADSTGSLVPCTYYNVTAGGNIPGFFNSPGMANVVYKPWTTVIVDLTNYIGQNITIRFTTFDCSLGGHYGYAYLDGSCQAFITGTADTVCAGITKSFCAPNGLGSYTWNGPGVTNLNGQCVTALAPGIYTCNTTMVTGCTGPQFTYTLSNFPKPVVSFNHSSSGPCSPNYTFTSNSSISSGFISSYLWNFGNGNANNQSTAYTFPAPGTYSVSLIAFSDKNCSDTISQNIAVYPYPQVSFTAPGTCKGAVVNFQNNSTISAGSITGYNWNFGNSGSTLQNPSHTFNSDGTFNVMLTATSNQGCSSTFTAPVTIHPLPIVNFNVNSVCLGIPSPFLNQSNISSGSISSYTWDFYNDGMATSNLSSVNYTYPSYGTYTVKLQAESSYNCQSSISKTVAVFPNPVSQFTAPNVCLGEGMLFTNQSTVNSGNIITNQWTFGDGSTGTNMSPTHVYAMAGTYTAQLQVISNNICSHTQSVVVTVYARPVVNFTSNSACVNQTTQFNNSTVINGGTIAKWRWDFQNDGIWDDTLNVNPALVYPANGIYNCRLQAVSNNQCASHQINPVYIHANPVAGFFTKSSCLGDISTFTNTSYSSDGAITSYQWDFSGDNITDNIFPNPTYTFGAHGVYPVKLEIQTQFGCTNILTKSVYVNPKPEPLFTAQNPKGCPQLCVNFTNGSHIATGSIVTYQWIFGDGTQANYQTNPSHCFNTGKYNITLKAVSDSNCVASVTRQNFVEVYPLPLAGFKVDPEEIDENEPNIYVSNNSTGASTVNYYINDGTQLSVLNFNHTLKNADKIKPVIVQVVTNEFGCGDTVMEILKVKPSFVIYIPNTFTPNGDGLNDGFFAKGVGISEFTIRVFDRWGHLVFETNNMDNAWDGHTNSSDQPIKNDVYVWKATVKDVFNKNHELTGHVTLLK